VTERLYYNDSFMREFDAQVISCEPLDAAKSEERFRVLLNRTVFYPTSGGQPHDLGTLGGATIVDVVDEQSGAIAHIVGRKLPTGAVHGVIDWTRRFDHMQQHTGQHLLSAAFVELFGWQTLSFHLGREVSSIDLACSAFSPKHEEKAERLANEVIFDDRAVTVRFGTAEELAALGLRKQVDAELAARAGKEGILRAIEIADFDRQPCGGTHVSRTGQVGVILLRKVEKQKKNWRVEFVCGWRALAAAQGDFAALAEAARLLSCGMPEVPALVRKTLEERNGLHRAGQRLAEQLVEHEARALLDGASPAAGGVRVIARWFEDSDTGYLRGLATRLVAGEGVMVVLGSRGGAVVAAKSGNVPGELNVLFREVVAALGGKGGGTRDFAQGNLPVERWTEFCERLLAKRAGS
jgi:alanyl-tRNA synthetase